MLPSPGCNRGVQGVSSAEWHQASSRQRAVPEPPSGRTQCWATGWGGVGGRWREQRLRLRGQVISGLARTCSLTTGRSLSPAKPVSLTAKWKW